MKKHVLRQKTMPSINEEIEEIINKGLPIMKVGPYHDFGWQACIHATMLRKFPIENILEANFKKRDLLGDITQAVALGMIFSDSLSEEQKEKVKNQLSDHLISYFLMGGLASSESLSIFQDIVGRTVSLPKSVESKVLKIPSSRFEQLARYFKVDNFMVVLSETHQEAYFNGLTTQEKEMWADMLEASSIKQVSEDMYPTNAQTAKISHSILNWRENQKTKTMLSDEVSDIKDKKPASSVSPNKKI